MSDGRKRDEEQVPIVVTDRRRFTETGDAREDVAPAPEVPRREASPGAPPEPQRLAAEPSDLGIGSLFYLLFSSALAALGLPDAMGERMPVNLAQAREMIELLRVLQQATRGNLSAEEEAGLKQMLHEAQVAYVRAAGGASGGGRA